MPPTLRLAAAGLLALCFALPVHAAKLTSMGATYPAQAGVARPDFPQPDDPNQLFYLQRTTNANTVVYAANYDAEGRLDARNPISVYWRRFATTGHRRQLTPIERFLAFGVRVQPRGVPGEFTVIPRAAPQHPLVLRQTGPGRAEILAPLGGGMARLSHVFLEIDETGLLPAVRKAIVHGTDLASGRAVIETFAVSGGGFRP